MATCGLLAWIALLCFGCPVTAVTSDEQKGSLGWLFIRLAAMFNKPTVAGHNSILRVVMYLSDLRGNSHWDVLLVLI